MGRLPASYGLYLLAAIALSMASEWACSRALRSDPPDSPRRAGWAHGRAGLAAAGVAAAILVWQLGVRGHHPTVQYDPSGAEGLWYSEFVAAFLALYALVAEFLSAETSRSFRPIWLVAAELSASATACLVLWVCVQNFPSV